MRKTGPVALLTACLASLLTTTGVAGPDPVEIALPRIEVYPDWIQARLEQRERDDRRLPRELDGLPLELVIELLTLWAVDARVTVAFNGGTPELHRQIEEVATTWTQDAGLELDFGFDAGTGSYRLWTAGDPSYAADIRIGFDSPGYWSLVGMDSRDPSIVHPGEASMNLSGFAAPLAEDQRGTVLHEFGHALGFHHEHQSPRGGCDSEFRWDDDPDGTPGIYTLLGGSPNFWPRAKVDHNLRQLPNSDAYLATPHDPSSIMHYAFPTWMFHRGEQSHCFTERNNVLSEMDVANVIAAYPAPEGPAFESGRDRRVGVPGGAWELPAASPERRELLRERLGELRRQLGE